MSLQLDLQVQICILVLQEIPGIRIICQVVQVGGRYCFVSCWFSNPCDGNRYIWVDSFTCRNVWCIWTKTDLRVSQCVWCYSFSLVARYSWSNGTICF